MTEANRREGKRAVLLLAHGAPERLQDIPEFLLRVRNGRPLPPQAVEEIRGRYARIGGGSPLLRLTRRQADALAARLGWPVYVGMRNWHPLIDDAVQRINRDGVERLVAICLAPQNSRTSIGKYRRCLDEALGKHGAPAHVEFIEEWHTQPELVEAFAEKLRATLEQSCAAAGHELPVILTAHSVPQRTVAEGDPYDCQVRDTAGRVARAADIRNWELAYQSQGMTSEDWLGPSVESCLDRLAAAGHRHVIVAPIGFVSDHVEVLYDIDVAYRDYARARGLTLWRPPSLNDSPRFIEALAALARACVRS